MSIFNLLQIGVWKSWEKDGLDIKDIVWPGNSHTPPQGVPEKFHLKITFLEEQPYIGLSPPDPVTGKCSMNRGVLCRVSTDPELATLGWVYYCIENCAHAFQKDPKNAIPTRQKRGWYCCLPTNLSLSRNATWQGFLLAIHALLWSARPRLSKGGTSWILRRSAVSFCAHCGVSLRAQRRQGSRSI